MNKYWEDIPIGKENAASYSDLMTVWGLSKRGVRDRLHELSKYDSDDGMILIRSSKSRGFYRTDNHEQIAAYRREVYNRACHTFAPLRRIDRILGNNENQLVIEL